MEVTGRDAVSLFYGHTDRCAYNKKSISTVAVEICIFSAFTAHFFAIKIITASSLGSEKI